MELPSLPRPASAGQRHRFGIRLIRLPSIRLKLRNRAASVSFRKGQDGWRGVESRRGLANGDLIRRCRRV